MAPALNAAAKAQPGREAAVDYYNRLGVTKIINAAGTYTMFTASVMPQQVQAAVALAANIRCAWANCRRKPENIWRVS